MNTKKQIAKVSTEATLVECSPLSMDDVQAKIIELRNQLVILDCDVAELYGVATKEVNQAVKNNPNKFPLGYLMDVNKYEKNELVKNFDRFNMLKHSVVCPTAFTERGK